MALSKSVADVIQENENWLRLATFLHEPLKYGLLRVLHNTSNDPTYVGLSDNPIQLYQEFTKHGNLITTLVKKRVLQKDQVDLLLPPNDNKTDSSKFDVTLIVVLIINFTTLIPPLNGWKDKNPPPHDRSKGAGVIRGRNWRNFVHHNEPKDIDEAIFNQKWAEGTQIINDLGYHYDTNKLKVTSLDPKGEYGRKALYLFIKRLKTKIDTVEAKHDSLQTKHDSLQTKHDSLEVKQDSLQTKHDSLEVKQDSSEAKRDSDLKLISSLTHQLNKITNEVQHLRTERETKKQADELSTSSFCLKSVLEYISNEIKEEEAKELLGCLNVQTGGDFVNRLKSVPWENIKRELEMMKRKDIVEHIKRNTLITRGLQAASDNLRDHYKIELIKCLVEQPLSSVESDSQYVSREEIYIDLVVLPSSTVDEQYSNSDRAALIKQNLIDKSSTEKAVDKIIQPQDELVFMRGVAGIGKSTLIDMFTFKWAKNELSKTSVFDFVFMFTCRELNQSLNEFKTLEELLKLKFPNIFCNITLKDLADVSERVLIVVDGLDELEDIYKMDGMNTSSIAQAPFLQVIFDLINPKSMKSLKNHKSIVCGRPKACEFVKNQFSKLSRIKTIEICGFSHLNVRKYILNFFDKNYTKAKLVENIIASSNNLKVMSTVPVFLWVICNVYMENLIKKPINTNTELYFYTCLVFLRNHYQGTSRNYENLLDIVNDQDIVDVVYSLMVLSVKTYMQNQVLFTDEDIKKLNCPIHLEQTGFIVKYSRSNTAESTFQFRHLILQEFLCGMYLCVTKGISPFLSNRELSSCLPTIFGIHRTIQDKRNAIFMQFFKSLQKSNQRFSSIFAKLFTPFRSLSYNKFMKKNIPSKLELPPSMIKNKTLSITDEPECREFLDIFKESNYDIEAPLIINVVIELRIYKDYRMILNLLGKLNIAMIGQFKIISSDIFDANGSMDENILRLYKMTAGTSTEAVIYLSPRDINIQIICTGEKLSLYFQAPLSVINILNSLEKLHMTKIDIFDIQSKDLFDENGNMDENILRLYKMTAGTSTKAVIYLSPHYIESHIICTGEKLSLYFQAPLSVINILNSLDKLHITKIHEFQIQSEDLFDENGNMDENIIRLYKMTAGSSIRTVIECSSCKNDNHIQCTRQKLSMSFNAPLSVVSMLNLLGKLQITKIHEFNIEEDHIFDERGNMDGNVLRLCEKVEKSSIRRIILILLSNKQDNRIGFAGGELYLYLHASALLFLPEFIKTTSNQIAIHINSDVILHGTVCKFVQEITKYAIEHGKIIQFSIYSSATYSSFKTLLKDAGIDINSCYIDILGNFYK